MQKNLFLAACLAFAPTLFAQTTIQLDSTILQYRTVIDTLNIPWEIIWGQDNHIWTTERHGRVSRINPDNGNQDIILDISASVYAQSESGMLGMVMHPNFADTPHVFIAYTYLQSSQIFERLVKYEYNGTSLVNPDTLVDNIVGNTTHIGARLLILPDNTLLMTTGDAQNQSAPQNINNLSGKILRMNLDGSVPADNPISGSLVWSWGHRNVQGLIAAPNGNIYCSEHGPTSDDELFIVEPAQNHGWPTVSGFCDNPLEMIFCTDSNVVEPLMVWTPTIAPSDLAWYPYPNIPEWENKLLMTVLKDKQLISFSLNAAGTSILSSNTYFTNTFQRLRDICVAPDGRVFLATNGASWSNTSPFTHQIVELRPPTLVSTRELVADRLSVQIAPNPSTQGEQIRLQLPDTAPAELRIFDAQGRVVLQKSNIVSGLQAIDLPQGLYFYEVWQNNKKAVGKLQIL